MRLDSAARPLGARTTCGPAGFSDRDEGRSRVAHPNDQKGVLMARTLSNPAGLHPAPGFSHVAVSRGSSMVHFAGQIALDENFGIIGGADLFEQTQAAMRNLETAMKEAGVDWQDIVRRTIYTTQPTQYEVISSAIHSVTGGADDPPQTIVGITGLAIDGLLIEIECTAVLD